MGRTRSRWLRWASAVMAGLSSTPALGQDPPAHGQPGHVCSTRREGPFRRAARGANRFIHKYAVGRPELFDEPPLGASVFGPLVLMEANAEIHQFTLYRSDFVGGSDALTLDGTSRWRRMAVRLPSWAGPVVVEWTPERPGLAELRQAKIAAMLQTYGLAAGPERVVVGPPSAPGLPGPDAANNHDNLVERHSRAARLFGVTPAPGASNDEDSSR